MYWIVDIDGDYINLEHAFSIVTEWENVETEAECVLVSAYFPFLDRDNKPFYRPIRRFDKEGYEEACKFMSEITHKAMKGF
ncbi:MAG: hypothetical protein A3F13_02555 [Gammaproteobacteria bacterium RIFCSPHIGHO2_12_FULL_40_19]|nr:MAG: hypothetical protein A3F13_02555 [Gammaproteobacteria bacterium RIFCSPHIGHO2_12_FULL_40_19]